MPKMIRECCWLERFWARLGQQKGPEPLAGVALQEEGTLGTKLELKGSCEQRKNPPSSLPGCVCLLGLPQSNSADWVGQNTRN